MNTSPAAPGSVRRQRRVLIGLALLFFAPLGLAFFLYYGVGWRPGGRVNNGELIDPPRPLPALALPRVDPDGTAPDRLTAPDFLTRKWTLLYWGEAHVPSAARSICTTRARSASRSVATWVACSGFSLPKASVATSNFSAGSTRI